VTVNKKPHNFPSDTLFSAQDDFRFLTRQPDAWSCSGRRSFFWCICPYAGCVTTATRYERGLLQIARGLNERLFQDLTPIRALRPRCAQQLDCEPASAAPKKFLLSSRSSAKPLRKEKCQDYRKSRCHDYRRIVGYGVKLPRFS